MLLNNKKRFFQKTKTKKEHLFYVEDHLEPPLTCNVRAYNERCRVGKHLFYILLSGACGRYKTHSTQHWACGVTTKSLIVVNIIFIELNSRFNNVTWSHSKII